MLVDVRRMKKIVLLFGVLVFLGFSQSCGIYNFSGASTGTAESFQVNFFQNYADQSPGSTIEPQLDRDFTNALTRFDCQPYQPIPYQQWG